jgi:hypothetical protein
MSSCCPTTVLENSLVIAVLLSEDDLTHLATFELLHASHGGLRARNQITCVSGILGDLDSAPGDPAIDPLRVDVELLGHFNDRVPRWPVAAAEPAQTRTNLVLATMLRDDLRREPPSLARCESFPLQLLGDRDVGLSCAGENADSLDQASFPFRAADRADRNLDRSLTTERAQTQRLCHQGQTETLTFRILGKRRRERRGIEGVRIEPRP